MNCIENWSLIEFSSFTINRGLGFFAVTLSFFQSNHCDLTQCDRFAAAYSESNDEVRNYVRCLSGIARSTNCVEKWHHGLRSCSSATIQPFMSGIQRDVVFRSTTGASHSSEKKYRALNERVTRAVATYGRAEVLVYLRFIAYLSHTWTLNNFSAATRNYTNIT